MDEKPATCRSMFAVWRWRKRVLIPLAFLMLLGYPLSLGPVCWLFERGYAPASAEPIVIVIYYPLLIACENNSVAQNIFDPYADWWRSL